MSLELIITLTVTRYRSLLLRDVRQRLSSLTDAPFVGFLPPEVKNLPPLRLGAVPGGCPVGISCDHQPSGTGLKPTVRRRSRAMVRKTRRPSRTAFRLLAP